MDGSGSSDAAASSNATPSNDGKKKKLAKKAQKGEITTMESFYDCVRHGIQVHLLIAPTQLLV
jgi:hypothetical protein